MRIMVGSGDAISSWKQKLGLFREACSDFVLEEGVDLGEYEVSESTRVADVIYEHIGERPRIYTADELGKTYLQFRNELSNCASQEVIDDTINYAATEPSVYLSTSGSHCTPLRPMWQGTLADLQITDGEVLLLHRASVERVVWGANYRRMRSRTIACMEMVRDAADFFEAVQRCHHTPRERIPGIGLLYTEEDVDIASYVRTHYDELDVASGEDCAFIFVENPEAVAAVRFWRPLLGAKLYAAWRLLGWARSVPYDKTAVYQIARQLELRVDRIPCAVVFEPGTLEVSDAIPLQGNITRALRGLIARFQTPMSSKKEERLRYRERGLEKPPAASGRPLIFLSHSSSDKDLVRPVAVQLQSLGFETWFDEWRIRPGNSVTEGVEQALDVATIVVIFLSRRSLASTWVDAEMRAALHAQIEVRRYQALIPVVLDDCDIPSLLRDYRRVTATDVAAIVKEIAEMACSDIQDVTSAATLGIRKSDRESSP